MDVIFVCKDYIVINKSYGMLSERAVGRENVPDAVRGYLDAAGLPYEDVFPVHRLDATTAGVMVYALTKSAAAALSKSITDGSFRKRYRAWITADPDLPRTGIMEDRLFFDRRADKAFVVGAHKSGGKAARLSYSLGDAFDLDGVMVTPADVVLETGRTHQIRVQFASRKSPLLGDGKYGSRVKRRAPALWSVEIAFPWHGEERIYRLPM